MSPVSPCAHAFVDPKPPYAVPLDRGSVPSAGRDESDVVPMAFPLPDSSVFPDSTSSWPLSCRCSCCCCCRLPDVG